MSKRSYKRVLEWVAQATTVMAGGAATEEENERIELGLRDDEVAEIHKIIMSAQWTEDFDAAKILNISCWVSMDPDSVYSADLYDDLETITFRSLRSRSVGIHAGTENVLKPYDEKVYDFVDHPVLVGTDLGIGVYATVDVGTLDANAVTSQARIYFTRRKANVSELNQILLKRR